ncbi:MAG: cell division topological specificity factor MinE [Desulfurella sp.]|uniref:Cell division topological specificity factor n=1 Tax=Desulfurella multipotens TaxID=79269 RepID=A0A1G6JZA2_9BACT|nr:MULTISPECIES: cell division topological specificity factor MinE [Desulfurella]AHF97142.1 cell division topological specificity factor MinE [Desulfurella acetivorans A63]HEX12926.1 cell division topological specificity factor MinE [Desulfurella acetivorans]PMP63982.1 MAG: cell division topological specificity factor MinE [Desulfurella multipotens]PMP87386.1 MAG: cell division topological specificity factor MinE [Desulfurella sp.]SDC23366.1 cell division topological specificity factor [Desulf
MRLLDFFTKRRESANVAKDRLQIILAHERQLNSAPFVEDLRKDLISVISKYVNIDPTRIDVKLERDNHLEILEINIPLR